MTAAIVYPHQLFGHIDWLRSADTVYLVEDPLFFSQYPFHRQKLMLHRASMQSYAKHLRGKRVRVEIIEAATLNHTADVAERIVADGHDRVHCIDPDDTNLLQRLASGCRGRALELEVTEHPDFLTTPGQMEGFTQGKSKLFFTQFYIEQRKRLGILLDDDGKPLGGKWSFDTENRRKLPAGITVPESPMDAVRATPETREAIEARRYVDSQFPKSLGTAGPLLYPHDRTTALQQLDAFVEQRLGMFGDYEDAISREHTVLYHSVLTPTLNIGLLSPQQILQRALSHSDRVSLNSLEGFVRQIIGWREYMRLVYRSFGTAQRTRNYWQHDRPLPQAFYDGSTGIEPVDHVIHRVLRDGYCHHIERLMILGNFMLLCEIHPDAIYRWFMEMFVDAYDWVMVPNVYGMSQHADGGKITTKPYISGSSYVLKMSNFKKGPWCEVWDGLYWSFIARHRSFFESNPRMKVMTGQLDRMGDRLQTHQQHAETFLSTL